MNVNEITPKLAVKLISAEPIAFAAYLAGTLPELGGYGALQALTEGLLKEDGFWKDQARQKDLSAKMTAAVEKVAMEHDWDVVELAAWHMYCLARLLGQRTKGAVHDCDNECTCENTSADQTNDESIAYQ